MQDNLATYTLTYDVNLPGQEVFQDTNSVWGKKKARQLAQALDDSVFITNIRITTTEEVEIDFEPISR